MNNQNKKDQQKYSTTNGAQRKHAIVDKNKRGLPSAFDFLYTVIFTLLLAATHSSTYASADLASNKASVTSVISEDKIMALNNEIKAILDQDIRKIRSKQRRLLKLHELLFSPLYGLNIQYHPEGTKTAIETFNTGYGNCISHANLFVAAARYVGLDARYQTVKLSREWRPKDGFYVVPGHVNVVVLLPQKKATIEFNSAFLESMDQYKLETKIISDRQALAEYYNNVAMEKFEKQLYDEAISHLKKSTGIYNRLDYAWSNLGVVYKYSGNLKKAEESYLKSLKINRSNLSAINNIHILYRELGDEEKAKNYAKKADKYSRKNPYYLEKLANSAIAEKDFEEAVKLLTRATRIYAYEPRFFHGLAKAYFYQQEIEKSSKALQRAKSLSESDEFKNRYQKKINALFTSR